MTQFINRNKPEKVEKNETVFTHVLGNKEFIPSGNTRPENWDRVEHLYNGDDNGDEDNIDIFLASDNDGCCCIYLGKKGDEFED